MCSDIRLMVMRGATPMIVRSAGAMVVVAIATIVLGTGMTMAIPSEVITEMYIFLLLRRQNIYTHRNTQHEYYLLYRLRPSII